LNATYEAIPLVGFPAGSGKITADHTLHGKGLGFFYEDTAIPQVGMIGLTGVRILVDISSDHMILHKRGHHLEPEKGNLREDDSFVWNRIGQDDIKGGHPIRGDHQIGITEIVHISNLASLDQVKGREIGFSNNMGHVSIPLNKKEGRQVSPSIP
jgi:hypothetical protein